MNLNKKRNFTKYITYFYLIVSILLFIYTFYNFNNEFRSSFKSLEQLNFHEKYSDKIHHIRNPIILDWLWKEPKAEDLLFTEINSIKNKDIIVLFQGDSYMEQLTLSKNNISAKDIFYQTYNPKKSIGDLICKICDPSSFK